MKRLLLFGVLGCVLASGCVRTFSIKEKSKDVPGLPFYLKRMACQQSTSYLEPVYDIIVSRETLSKDSAGSTSRNATEIARKSIAMSTLQSSQAWLELRNAFMNANVDEKTFRPKFDALPSWDANSVFDPANRILAKNETTPRLYVDYTTTYYFNMKRPWSGSTSSELGFREDGTLSTVKVTVEDKTFEQIAGLLPISEYLTAKYVPTADEITALDVPPSVITEWRLTLKVQATVYKHTLSKQRELPDTTQGRCPPYQSIDLTAANASALDYSRSQVSATSSSEKKKKNAIGVSGEITLPESGAEK